MSPAARRLAGWSATHLLGMMGWSALSPVVVAYAFLIAGTGGLLLASADLGTNESALAQLAETFLVLNLVWIDRAWSSDLSFQQNALRLFGLLGYVGWLLELVVWRIRGGPPARQGLVDRLKGRVLRLGVFTLGLCSVMFAAMLTVEWAGDPPLWRRILQGGGTAFGAGLLIFVLSVPGVVLHLGIGEIRGPVTRAIIAGARRDPEEWKGEASRSR